MPGLDEEAYYIGGSPCAGKSTVTQLLARRHGLRAFSCDEGSGPRLALVRSSASSALRKLTTLTDCERWRRNPSWQFDKEILFYREQFPYLLADLRAAPRPWIAEGADLLPELLHSVPVPPGRAVWIVPTPGFQLEHYSRRDWAQNLVADCPDPTVAFGNWMQRDILFAEHVAAQARRLGGPVVVVDGSRTVGQVAAEVERHLGLGASVPDR